MNNDNRDKNIQDEIDLLLDGAEKIIKDSRDRNDNNNINVNKDNKPNDNDIEQKLPNDYVCNQCKATEFELSESSIKRGKNVYDIYKCKKCGHPVWVNLNFQGLE